MLRGYQACSAVQPQTLVLIGTPDMSRPKFTPAWATPFNLATVDLQMRREEAYTRHGHTARTLVRERDLRITLGFSQGSAP
jgi:hypothetical protein